MRNTIRFSLFIIMTVILFQGCSLKARIKRADKRYAIGEYFAAGDLYKRVYGRIPYKQKVLRARIAYQQGECNRLINNNTRAVQPYKNAIRFNYDDSIVYLHYAQALQSLGKYGEAMNNYNIYLKKDSTSQLALAGIKSCREVNVWRSKPTRYIVKKADLFNVRGADNFSPAFLDPEGDALIFTSTREFNKKLAIKNSTITGLPNNNMFMTRKNASGKWEKPFIVGSDINTLDDDDGVCSISSDGKVMYFTRARQVLDAQIGTEIFTSNRAGGAWSTPQKMKIFADTTVSVAHPAISPDGQTLYFVSDARNGFGGKDILKATIDKGEAKYVENLGAQINTPGDEMFPTMREDGTLYFSSNGHPGFGGLDLFKATWKDSIWTVENMGVPLNSPADDFGMTFMKGTEETGYFSSNRNDTKGYDAIWSFNLPLLSYILEGKVVDETGNVIPDATVRMVTSTGINARVQTKKDGSYRIKLDKDQNCVLQASARGYLNQKNELSTMGLTSSKTYTIDFKLAAIYKSVKIDNIFYEFGKWDLTPASETGLKGLVKMLKDNPNITIEIGSHTDYIGTNDSNIVLSEKRAKSVVDYLISAGIAPERLSSVGHGEDTPVTVDEALAQKYPFLKVNSILNEEHVLTLTTEQQELANQINRRTEFRVVKTTFKPRR